MNILYILQQSVYDKEGKWTTADSNINMMVGILRELSKKRKKWKFYVLIDKLKKFRDLKSYLDLIEAENVKFVPFSFFVNAFLNRYNFCVREFEKVARSIGKIDVIWNNITEFTRNIKTYFYFRQGYLPKFITCCYWLDLPYLNQSKVPREVTYFWRQFDGFECSDLCVFTCKSTLEAFKNHLILLFRDTFLSDLNLKTTIWDFGYSKDEILKYKPKEREIPNKKTILFLNRLSKINYTHHIEFIEAIKILKSRRNDFQVVFTNPSMKVSFKYLKRVVPNLFVYKEDVLTREEYVKLLWQGDISVHLFEKELYGGCSFREAIEANNIPITLPIYEYARILGKSYPFYLKNITPQEIANVLNTVLDSFDICDFRGTGSFLEIKMRNYESSFEKVSNKVIMDIEKLFKG